MDPRELDVCVTGCAHAHQRLLHDLDHRLAAGTVDLTDASRLPNWTVGHVLAHVAGNAEAFTRVVEAATRGEVGAMYPDGREGRWARIEELAQRDAEALVGAVRRSIWALEAAWAACTADGWRGYGAGLAGEIPVAEVPLRRWREVEVHRTDAGWGYLPTQWDPAYVERDLPVHTARWLAVNDASELPAAALTLAPGDRLAWLLGRTQTPDLPPGLTL